LSRDELDAETIIQVFNAFDVDYVVIGAFAAIAHQAPIPPTKDIDFVPSTTKENLARLSLALHELGAQIRVDSKALGLAFDPSPEFLAGMDMLNLTCDAGHFDIVFFPSGFAGYEDLIGSAQSLVVGMTQASVASLADVVRSKQMAARPKDRRVLPVLERFLRTREYGNDVDF
jgi:hypothetical protein